MFHTPFVRAHFHREGGKWQLRKVGPIAAKDIPEDHHSEVIDFAKEYFKGRRTEQAKKPDIRYSIAILMNPQEAMPPSNETAIKRFIKAAEKLHMEAEIIGKDDYSRLGEFDALFIRETTAVNHHTFRFARRAAAEGLVVIDDPESILRCGNKVYLNELLEKNGIPAPRTLVVHRDNTDEISDAVGFPCVLKQPDSSFSQGVSKADDEVSLKRELTQLFEKSDLLIAQEFMPTEFDWRVGVFDRKPIYLCKYFMAKKDWKVISKDKAGRTLNGRSETIPMELAPKKLISLALKAANLIGDGLYGLDIKQTGANSFCVIEINDNPNIDHGYEDLIRKDDLFLGIMEVFLQRITGGERRAELSMSLVEHLHLFAGYGIEMEYMIVDRQTLALRPLCDYVLTEAAGECVNEVAVGEMAWSNELVLHVIELKTNGPAKTLTGLHQLFLRDIKKINEILAVKNAMLMPTAMHPFMNPATDTKLWNHDDAAVYNAYDRIFGCKGHGWSNLQSVHINLPFYNDAEFGKLHAAVRLILPILPALAASSPVYEGKVSGLMDSRLEFYRHNQKAIPEIAGKVIPEPAYSEKAYGELIFEKIYKAIKPHDPEGILQNEWLNSRGAIARFDRHAIEIRVLDIQESPRMDLAVISSVVSAVQALVLGKWGSAEAHKAWSEDALAPLFVECLRHGSEAAIENDEYLQVFGYPGKGPIKAQELWRHITDDLLKAATYPLSSYQREVDALVRHGCLARRLVKALGPEPDAARIHGVYGQLCHLLPLGGAFDAPC